MNGETTSAGTVIFKDYTVILCKDYSVIGKDPKSLSEMIKESGYLPQQVFHTDGTGLFWGNMLARTYLAKEKGIPDFKDSKNRHALLFSEMVLGITN